MQTIVDIFRIWPTTAAMASEVHQKYDTVRKWKKFGRIPATSWEAVIEAAAARGKRVTPEELYQAVPQTKSNQAEASA